MMAFVAVMVMTAAVGAGFWFECGQFFMHFGAQAFQHFLQDGILAYAQKAVTVFMADLCLRMTITQMEGTAQ